MDPQDWPEISRVWLTSQTSLHAGLPTGLLHSVLGSLMFDVYFVGPGRPLFGDSDMMTTFLRKRLRFFRIQYPAISQVIGLHEHARAAPMSCTLTATQARSLDRPQDLRLD